MSWKNAWWVVHSPSHERVPDEQLAGVLGVDLRVQHPALGDDRDAVEQHLLERHRRALLGRPGGLGVGALHQVRAELLGPLRLDARGVAGPQARGLDELAGHDPRGRLLGEAGAGEDREPGAARAEVLVAAALAVGPAGRRLAVALAAAPDLGDLLHADLR